MGLREEFERVGNWLFRWRSYLPLLLSVVILLGMRNFRLIGDSHLWDRVWEVICLIISFFGLAIRAYVVGHVPSGTSGRNTREQRAECLNTTGLYSVVRHPLYLGNFFCWFGVSLFPHVWWVSMTVVLIFWLYYERIMFAEEEFLRRKFGKAYETWSENTPAFLPRFKNWRPPSQPFSVKKVLRKEYSGWFAVIASLTLLEVVGDVCCKGRIEIDLMWLILFLAGLTSYVILRILKKATALLNVEAEKEVSRVTMDEPRTFSRLQN